MEQLDFSYLIAPFTAADFFDQYWQQSALLMKRGEAGRYRKLFAAAGAADILALAGRLPGDAVEVIGRIRTGEKSGEATPEEGNALTDSFRGGATIRVKSIERFCEPLGEFCKQLEAELSFPVRANLYCTPGNSRGFDLHFDTHEVFVLQILGKKQWQIFAPAARLPLEFVPPLPFEQDRAALKRARGGRKAGQDDINETETGALVLEPLLEPGDCLYLPRGFLHQADAQAEPSVHLTIGIHVLTWLDLLAVALGQTAYRHEEFRRALPVGLLRERTEVGESGADQAGEFQKQLDALTQLFGSDAVFGNAVSEMAESFARRQPGASLVDHQAVGEIESVERIDSETKLAGNGSLGFCLAADGSMAGLRSNGKELWLPAAFAPALRFVTERTVFRLDEIPGLVGDHGKLAFVRHLLRDGFVRLANE